MTDSPDSPHLGLAGIRGEIYMGFGAADELTPVELIPRFEEQVHAHGIVYSADVHPGAQHGFMLPGRGYEPTPQSAPGSVRWSSSAARCNPNRPPMAEPPGDGPT